MMNATILSVPPSEAYRMARDGARLVDVREPGEYRAGHAPDAELVPLGRVLSGQADLPDDQRLLLICATGNRSAHATQLLGQRGYDVVDVAGGMAAWQAQGLPVEH